MRDIADDSEAPSDKLRRHADDPAEGVDPDGPASGRDDGPREHAEESAEG